jgi:hypothetical protein
MNRVCIFENSCPWAMNSRPSAADSAGILNYCPWIVYSPMMLILQACCVISWAALGDTVEAPQ